MEQLARPHVVVIGFRGVARRIVKQLAKVVDQVLVIDPDLQRSELDTLRRYGVQYVEGYGQSQEVLQAADVAGAMAVICATGDDLRNIEIALLVRELSPNVRVVVQMANGNVGRALERVTQPSTVLEVAELASMSFIEAAVDRPSHPLMFGRRRFFVVTTTQRSTGTLRSNWGDIAPIAVWVDGAESVQTCPSRDLVVEAGARVTLLGAAEEFAAVGLAALLETPRVRRRHLRSRVREAVAAVHDAVDRPFRIALTILLLLAATSVFVLHHGYRYNDGGTMSYLDAMYFTVETIATVGFGDFFFRYQDAWLRMWAIVMMSLGATMVYAAVAFLTNALVSRRLAQSIGRQRVTGMRDHIVVIGLGAVGSKVALDLHDTGYDVAVIDSGTGQRFVPQMRAAQIPVLIADPTLPESLRDAGVDRAAGVAVLGNDDLLNIETGLAVKTVVGARRIPVALRVFGRNLARVIESSLDIGATRSVAELSAPWFVGAACGLDVFGTFYVQDTAFIAAKLEIRADDRLVGRAVGDLQDAARFVAIDRMDGYFEHPLQRTTTLAAGDNVYVVGRFEDLLDLLRA